MPSKIQLIQQLGDLDLLGYQAFLL
uniref:Uncharacterized protein n=1 Tax=Arundo donax TaxID=35708 RepID=A0A0A8ZKC1_ARUDO